MKIKTCFLVNLCHIFKVVSVNPYSLMGGKKSLGKIEEKIKLCSLFFSCAEGSQVSEVGGAGTGGPWPPLHLHPLPPAPTPSPY